MSNELKVGLLVIFAALAIFFGVRFLQGRPLLGQSYTLVAVFDDAQGVSPGTIVQLAGVRAGQVEAVRLGEGARRVYMTLEMDPGMVVPRGTTVGTGGFAALGNVTVALQPPARPLGGPPLASGDTLRAAPGGDLLTSLQAQAGPLAARTDTVLTEAALTLRASRALLDATGGDLAATLASVRDLTASTNALLQAEQARLRATLASAQRAAASAEALTADLSRFSGENADSLALTIRQLNRTLGQLETSVAGFDAVAVRLDTTLARVNSPEGSLGLLLQDRSLYDNANGAAASLQQLLFDVQRDPARYLRELRLVDVF